MARLRLSLPGSKRGRSKVYCLPYRIEGERVGCTVPVKVNKNILCVSAVFKLREIFRPFLPLALAQAAAAAAAVIVIVAAAATVAFVVWKFQHLFYMHCLGRFMFC